MKRNLLFNVLTLVLFLSGCKPAGDKFVDAVTDLITKEVTLKTNMEPDLGEISVGSDSRRIVLTVKNNSSDPIRNIKLEIGKNQSVLKYYPNEESAHVAPGFGGTCNETLDVNESCEYVLEFSTRKPGMFEIQVKLSYENTVKPEEKMLTFKALIGEPASLVFTNDKNLYNFGVIEKTDPSERILDLEIQNVGGLSARQVTLSLVNEENNGVRLIEHNCPEEIFPLAKCNVKLGYRPTDNTYNDSEMSFTGKLSLGYYKDPEGKTSKLNGVIKYKASTIEAKFSTNYSPIVFGTVVAGNKVTKPFKIFNAGYKEGDLIDLVFKDYANNVVGSCNDTLPGSSGSKIVCLPSSGTEFPFEVEDLNGCFTKMIKGKSSNLDGDNCYFNITYWPKSSWAAGSQIINNFDNLSIEVVYDSRFRDLYNKVNKPEMFNISASFNSVANIVLTGVKVDAINLSTIGTSGTGVYEANLGRLAKITDVSFSVNVQLTLTNKGESTATLNSFTDGALSAFNIPEATGLNLNDYYRGVKYEGCGTIAANGTCKLSFNLTPLDKGNPATEDGLMYDNISDPLKKYKSFIYNYNNGATTNDDGSVYAGSEAKFNLISKLIAKGFLAFSGSLSVNRPVLVHGKSEIFKVTLRNVGTGPIYAILPHTTKNFYPDSTVSFPFKVIDQGVLGVKDCYDLFYAKDFIPVDGVDSPASNKFLNAGETCELAVENALGEANRRTQSGYGASGLPNHYRNWSEYETPSEYWIRDSQEKTVTISFYYYDGDVDPNNAASLPFGLKQMTMDYQVKSRMKEPAYLTFRDPTPVQSAVIYRPAFTYPTLSMTYPMSYTLNSFSVVEDFFDYTTYNIVSNTLFYKATNSKTFFKASVPGPHTSFVYHMGTFKVGEVATGSLKLHNRGKTDAINLVATEETVAGSPIALKKYNTQNFSSPTSPYSFSYGQDILLEYEFAPTAAGEFKRCYTFEYENGLISNAKQSVCVIANAINTAPKLRFSVQDYNVTYDSDTQIVSESPTGIWTDFNPQFNNVNDTLVTNFEAVKASKVYGLKLFKITNVGDATANRASFSLLSGANMPGDNTEIATLNAPSGTTCGINMTLAPGASCQVFLKYSPKYSEAGSANDNFNFYMGVVFDRNSNQYVAQTMRMNFSALNPAKLSVSGTASEIVTNWSNPAIPENIQGSYPLQLNNYSKSNTHFIHSSATATRSFSVTVLNNNNLKASFLAMNPNPILGQTWNTILDNSNVKIEANRECFYGDDEFNATVPSDQKGFNVNTVNKCKLQVNFKASYTLSSCNATTKAYVARYGGDIISTCNPFVFKLNYFSYKRSTTDKFFLHVKGYIEPNRTTFSGGQVSNIFAVGTSSTKGSVSFKLPTSFSGVDASLGTITKYRIYYSTSFDDLYHKNVISYYTGSPVLQKIDTTASDITINNLTKGAYYFFKVFTERVYNHPVAGSVTYYSASDLPIFTIPVPDDKAYYSGDLKSLIDRSYINTQGALAQAVSKCSSYNYSFTIKGVSKTMKKSLITTTDWNDIISSSEKSLGYPMNDPGSVPHWLNDPAKNIASTISVYDGTFLPSFPNFDNTQLMMSDVDNRLLYKKSCTNSSSCNNLFKIVGGDDVELFYRGTFYTVNTAVAFPRCKATVLCPTNTSLLITSGSCTNP